MIKFYRNLKPGKFWSVKHGKSPVSHARNAILHGPIEFKHGGHTKGINICIAGGDRAVFPWAKAKLVEIIDDCRAKSLSMCGFERILFNPPSRGDRFFYVLRNGAKFKVDRADTCYAFSSGEFWGKGCR